MLIIDPSEIKTDADVVDPIIRSGQIAITEFTRHTFSVLVDLIPPLDLKQLFRESFGHAVRTKQYSIVSDLIKYSKEKFFPLFVTT